MKAPRYNSPIFHLTQEYEYCKIERPSNGTVSDTGETGRVWTEVDPETKVAIYPLSNANKSNLRLSDQGTNWMNYRLAIFEHDADIEPRDRITQYDNDVWYVYDIQPYPNTHKEAIICTIEEQY